MDTPRRRRRWRTLSIRSLLLLVLVAGGWLGCEARKIRRQKTAVAGIRALDGRFLYDWQWADGSRASASDGPPVPHWLRRTLGDEPFQDVARVSLGGDPPLSPRSCEASLGLLDSLPGLRSLSLGPDLATDRGMETVGRLTGLVELDMTSSSPRLGDAGVAHLRGLKNLRSLSIGASGITGRGLADLRSLTRLEELRLEGNDHVTDASLANLAGMKGLKKLNLYRMGDGSYGGGYTDAGLAHLAALSGLEELSVLGSDVSNAGLSRLLALRRLRVLCIDAYRNDIDDEGLATLTGLVHLEQLSLLSACVTTGGVRTLQAKRPKLKVYRH
jgi:hypothetical protein